MGGGQVLRTARATLRPVEASDLRALHALFVDPQFRRYIFDDEIVPPEATAEIIARSQAQFREQGHGLWLAHLPEAREPAGVVGFWYFHEPPQLELLYGLAPAQWGRGLATEIAAAMLRHGFERLGFERIVGSTDAPNVASCRVMERLGMRLLKRESVDGKETVFFVAEHAGDAPAR